MTNLPDLRQFAPATQRNREPILAVLQRVLPPEGTILEIASGTGEHAVFFAPQLKPRFWQPTEPNPILRESIASWREHLPSTQLNSPADLDVCQSVWPVETGEVTLSAPICAIVNINMIHISSWSACLGLMAGAERILPSGGVLYLYGPFQKAGIHTAPSNAAFDASLRSQNPAWGVRDLDQVTQVASEHHLERLEVIEMPANNLSVIFKKRMISP